MVPSFILSIHSFVEKERHIKIHDLIAHLPTEICHEVQVEPKLQPISSEQFCQASLNTEDGAHLDVSVNGFWGGSYVDVRKHIC